MQFRTKPKAPAAARSSAETYLHTELKRTAIDRATTPVMMTPDAMAFNQLAVSFVRSL